jgi:hydroxypyruvate isomerase
MNNTESTLAVNPTSVREIVSPTTKKVRGTQYVFACTETPQELKSRLKSAGLTGNKLSNAIREIRKGSMSLAWAETQVFLEGMRKEGYFPTQAQALKNTGVLRFEKLKEARAKKDSPEAIRAKTLEEIASKLRAMGLTEDEIAALS